MRPYGDERAQVSLETGTGRLTVILDGQIIEETWIEREFAGMYGMFVVGRHDNLKHIFPFAIEPGKIPSDHEPNIRRLWSRFENELPAQYLAFKDSDWQRDSCAS